ncbi:MAG: FAD binding domain-containing protein [Bacteroidetes bacterium]|nr:FAD binding domain-containing protein [Bacteroidota bacterium]
MIKFILNDQLVETSVLPTTVLLDFIRKEKKLTATKEGCREGDCGACTVLVGEVAGNRVKYKSVNSCLMPIGDANAKHIVTVEGINNELLTPVQEGMVEEGGTQCGFCTPGFVVSMTGYFLNHDKFEIDGAVDSIGGNICRCTGYAGIKRALEKANVAFSGNGTQAKTHLEKLISKEFVPKYFRDIPKRLKQIPTKPTKAKSKVVISGGTDLYVQKWEDLVRSNADFISADEKLKGIIKAKNRIRIGGAVTIEEIKNSDLLQKIFPHWNEYFNLFGSMPIRNRATVGGNIVNASPIADTVNILLALDAVVHLRNGKKNREVALKNFYKGYKTLNKKPDEIIEAVSFKVPPKNFFFNFEKISKRTFLDIASVNSSIYLELEKGKISVVHISAGGVAPIPLYLAKACKFLKSKSVDTKTVLIAASIAQTEISPINDARGSAEYKRLLLRQLIYAHFVKLFPEQIELPVPNSNGRN